jgi:enterochelin esterase-like enzyme
MEKRMIRISAICILTAIFALLSPALHGQKKQPGKKYDLFLKTSDSWKMLNKELTISRNIQSHDIKTIPGKYFHGALLKKELEGRKPGPVVFHVNFPSRGEFVFFLETVSDTGIVKISLDKKKLKTFTFLTGPENKGPWVASRLTGNGIYQCDYNKEYRISIPTGKHDIAVQNMGTDWLSIGYFVFTKYSGKILSPEYEEWKTYQTNLNNIDKRLGDYLEKAKIISALESGSLNYDVIPTLELQLENFAKLAENYVSVDFNLMRTEKELKEIYDYVDSEKNYLGTKRGRIKVGYISEIDSTVQPYDILVPKSYDPSKKYALVLSLHGYQNEIQKYSELVKDSENSVMDSLGIIKVGVYGRRNHFYSGAAEEDVLTVINEVESRYSIDNGKVYLTGSSMGGYGTWFIGMNYPHLFAALSPVCALSILNGTKLIETVSPIEYVANAQHLPARIYHGAMDSSVNVGNSRQMVDKLKELKYDYVYTEYPDAGHDVWNNADADTNRLPWLLQYTRELYPAKVRHKIFYLQYGKAYWLKITGKDNWKKYSEIQGEAVENNEIRIHTENIRSFFIDLKHLGLKSGEPIKLIIDRNSIVLNKYAEGMDFYLSKDSVWIAGVLEKGLSKRRGLEGPSIAIETKKFLIVYGTGKADTTGLSKKIGTLLQRSYLSSDMNIPLVPDTLVINEKLAQTYNLYLIGSPDVNLYLREIVPGLPVSFRKDSLVFDGTYSRMETGIQMIYPNPKQADKYIFVDVYPEFLPDIGQLVNFPVADYFIYSLKGG